MSSFKVIFALLCSIFVAKSAKIKTMHNGRYFVYAKSTSYDSGHSDVYDDCIISVNRSPNLCKNKRGHNIVVIDPETDEYQSVSFDTWLSKDEARNMSEYLKSVKMNSMIIMAIKDSTWSWNWEQDWIEYIDSYGSETHQNTEEGTLKFDPRYDSDIGCPFTAIRKSWVMVTQKLPVVNGTRQVPSWKKCKYDGGYSSVQVLVNANIQQHCSSPDRQIKECVNEVGGYRYLGNYTNKLKDGECYAAANCSYNFWCNPRYSVSEDLQANHCQKDGSWPNDFKCPTCQSKFGLEKVIDSEETYFALGETRTLKINIQVASIPEDGFYFYIIFNKTTVLGFNAHKNKLVFYRENGIQKDKNSSHNFSYKKITNENHEYTMSWTVNSSQMSYNDNELNFIVADLKDQSYPVIVHNYTRVIKVEDQCKNVTCPRFCDCISQSYNVHYCKLDVEKKKQHDYCSYEKTVCSLEHTEECKILKDYPFYKCVCKENSYGDSCRTTFRTLAAEEKMSKKINFEQGSVLHYANFSSIQNMKVNFSKLYVVYKEGGVYNLQNASVEFTVEYFNKTNNKSIIITVKSVPIDYYMFTRTNGIDFYMCDAKKLVQFYSDDIENSLTTAISKDFSMESVVCEIIFKSTSLDPCRLCNSASQKCAYSHYYPQYKCVPIQE